MSISVGAIGAMPSQFLLDAQGRSVSSAVSAMQPQSNDEPTRTDASRNARGRKSMACLGCIDQSANGTSPAASLSCSQAPRMSHTT